MRGNFVFTGCYRPGSSASVELGGGRHILSGWRGKSLPVQQRKMGFRQNQSVFWASFALQFVNVKIIFVWHYSTVDVCPAANAGAKLDNWRQRFAGDDWDVWQCVLGAGGAPVSAIVSPVWSPVKYRARAAAGLLRGTHFLLMKKAEEVALFRLVTCYLSLTGFQ